MCYKLIVIIVIFNINIWLIFSVTNLTKLIDKYLLIWVIIILIVITYIVY